MLTNSRSLDGPAAAELTTRAARGLITVAGRRGTRIQLVSRSDSTLRGHVMAEVAALQAVRRDMVGRGYDGVLLVPAFLEAGRVTAADIHWARTAAGLSRSVKPNSRRTLRLGTGASDLRVFVAEKSGGTIRPEDVRSISLADIRLGGPARVREVLASAAGGAWVVVNATEYSDLETVARGVLDAEDEGQSFLFRTGPSFVRALSGLGPRPALRGRRSGVRTGREGRARERARPGRGRLACRADQPSGRRAPGERGHDRHRTRRARGPDRRPGRAARRGRHARRVTRALGHSDVLLYTSREVVAARDVGAASRSLAPCPRPCPGSSATRWPPGPPG